jgi:DNA-binding IclR family transcriptional regulator
MPHLVFAILGALVERDGLGRVVQIMAASGYELTSVQRAIIPMVKQGWVARPFQGLWILTERGKIAFAIETGRRTKARARGEHYAAQPYRDFEKAA